MEEKNFPISIYKTSVSIITNPGTDNTPTDKVHNMSYVYGLKILNRFLGMSLNDILTGIYPLRIYYWKAK